MYCWGYHGNGVCGDITDDSNIPTLVYEIPIDERPMKELICNTKNCEILSSNGILRAWGKDSSKYGIYYSGDKFVPTKILPNNNITLHNCEGNNCLVQDNDDGTFLVSGSNTFNQLGINNYGGSSRDEFGPINMTLLMDQESDVVTVLAQNHHCFILYQNYDFFAWGGAVDVTYNRFLNENVSTYIVPTKIDLSSGYSHINISDDSEILEFKCNLACYLIIRYFKNVSYTDVFTWGFYQAYTECKLSRGDIEYWIWPRRIDKSGLEGNNVIHVAFLYYFPMYLTDAGKIYATGRNIKWAFIEISNQIAYQTSQYAKRILYDNDDVTYISSSGGYHIAVVTSTFLCFEKFPEEYSVCTNSRGNCTSEDTCICSNGYYGKDCSISKCWNHFSNESESCNGGDCLDTNQCMCKKRLDGIFLYEDEDCLSPLCNGKSNKGNISCNNEFGICIDGDVCECFNHHYGFECETIIKNAKFVNFDKTLIHVTYILNGSYFDDNSLKLSNFNCSFIIKDLKDVGDDVSCLFDYDVERDQIMKLVIGLNGKRRIKAGDYIYIKSFTRSNEYAELKLQKYPKNLFEEFWIYFYVIGPAVVFIIFIIIIVSILSICKIHGQRKSIRKFQEIDDIDVLLQERAAEKNNVKFVVNKSLFLINYEEISLIKEIGKGGSNAVIYLGKWNDTEVAFKVFKTQYLSTEKEYSEFEKELMLLSSLRHPFIVNFLGATIKEPRIGIVMEYCSNGCLEYYIKMEDDDISKKLSFSERCRMLFEIAQALQFIHTKEIIHRDVKCQNVLVTDDLTSKLIDFGFSKILNEGSKGDMTKYVGTSLLYVCRNPIFKLINDRAPEIVFSRNYSNKIDVFSYGILLYVVVFSNFCPYGSKSISHGIEISVANDGNFRPNIKMYQKRKNFESIRWITDLMQKCWSDDPEERPDFDTIIKIFQECDQKDEMENLRQRQSQVKSNDETTMSAKYDHMKKQFVDLIAKIENLDFNNDSDLLKQHIIKDIRIILNQIKINY